MRINKRTYKKTKLRIKKNIRLTNKEKELLSKALKFENKLLKSYKSNSTNIIQKFQKNITVKNYKEAVKVLEKINIADVFGLKVKIGQNFPCQIISGNIASINCKNGVYKYFSKSVNGSRTTIMGLIDVYEIVFACNYYQTLEDLCNLAKIQVEEGRWVNLQKIRYANNIRTIESAKEEMAHRYPALYKYIYKHLYLLEKMNCLGIKNIASDKEAVKDESIFFASARRIEEDFKTHDFEVDHTTINTVLNMFCALGLIDKVKANKVPKHLMRKARESVDEKCFVSTFFYIPTMNQEVLIEAEKRVMKLNKAKISVFNISISNVQKVLGKRICNDVYGDTVAKTSAIANSKELRKTDKNTMYADLDAAGL